MIFKNLSFPQLMNLRESLELVGSGVVESHGLKEGGQDWLLCCHNSLWSGICLGSRKRQSAFEDVSLVGYRYRY
jgi:hypothetical protein